jgi:hypothetical protein
MIENLKPVSNPLTIIAIFATIAEVSGTIVLPFIDHPNQLIFIYFLIVFPVLLVILFYLTLNFNHSVLYAPSDFRDEKFFFDLSRPVALSAVNAKLDSETKELQLQIATANSESIAVTNTTNKDLPAQTDTHIENVAHKPESYSELRRRYFVGEQLVLDRIAREENVVVKRNVRLIRQDGKATIFDGYFEQNGIVVIEVKIVFDTRIVVNIVTELKNNVSMLEPVGNLSILLAIVFDSAVRYSVNVRQSLEKIAKGSKIPIKIKFYNLPELEGEIGLSTSPET